ncbi:hypothetical protein MPH_07751 [Macrophomina phaseolina MS6]|uniref:Uncharacterized protein n=2 Tax=Macrophomina phaseolina TaxID=35725 RepID=K2RK97_MACPH|nr:hypothetical protein MPH_07751 [Macrophomina phaseolina MS6]
MLGVDDERVADEYALTDVGMAHVRPFFVAHLLESPAFKDDPEGAERMVRSRKENMLATLAMVREKYGGAEAYMRTVCGLSEDEIERIRQVMIVSEKQDGDEDTQKAAL